MVQEISRPAADEHIAPCGLFCTNCGKFKKGRCQGCQIQPGFAQCAARKCVIEKGITTCAQCPDFQHGRSFLECKKLNNFIAKFFALIFGSDRPGALAMLRDEGPEAYLKAKRASGRQ
jgi:hypothetical protein